LQFTRPSESPMTARAPPTSACHQCDQLFLGQHQRLTAKLRFPTRLHRKDRLRCQAWPRPTPHLTARPRRLTVRERESHRYYRPDRHRQNLVGLCLWPAKPRASIIPCPIYECRAPRWRFPRQTRSCPTTGPRRLGTHSRNDQERLDLLEIFEEHYGRKIHSNEGAGWQAARGARHWQGNLFVSTTRRAIP
jgi:hypothetical protein